MHVEYEIRVLEIDKDEIIKKIKALGGTLEGEYEQKRYVYDFIPKIDNKWIRLRTDGTKTTLTIKEIANSNIDGTKELEIEVDDFAATNKLLNELGFQPKGYQENKRTRYLLNGVEIDIDQWPMIPAYLEIEGKNEEEINQMIELLEVDKTKVTSKDVMGIYFDVYNIDIEQIEYLKF